MKDQIEDDDHDRRRKEDKALIKEAVKETLREWLDEKYVVFGKWSFRGILAMLLAAIAYFISTQNGWYR